ncbi:SusE domain-containing protein [Sphingobacterium litopenaei]|uniref:SusE domain-containing protein n=1 Tax=Sphingobacterium litopenaei TaxID=2763500 RepID=A0ABR7YAR5_9SPHI|nr:SusE domain-containing protein [Sphingobacterium litopenaei]MBD1428377.1 SusE domain-containing protein [Sphingobacterium litopenaei]
MKNLILLYTLLLIVCACTKEGDKVIVSGFEAPTLSSTKTQLDLEEVNAQNLALQIVWQQPVLNASQPISQKAIKNTLQLSVDQNFSTIGRSIDSDASSISYTHEQLNRILLGLGFAPNEGKTLYARVVSKLANNITPLYSNVIPIALKAYQPAENADYLHMSNKDMTQFPWKLCSRNKNGFYDGFVQVDQWYNFYLLDEPSAAASKIYGSYPADNGQYKLHAGDDRWNCWTNNGGYLYISADVNKLEWKEIVISSLSVTGDFNGWSTSANSMTYDAQAKVWKATITTTAPEQWGMKILVNESWSWFFGTAENEGECTLYGADASGFKYDKVGTHTLILDLSDPKAFKYSIQ